ncbi:Amino-acid acetyltransferase, mitochondrial [Lithohypha guttulata]|uniref:Amino-acid acetyltransferase, mitochondrial n=1 Tax=Lithohypha guttulata TaxID=1690604 RepID=UPI002DDF721F|nr:Amino-acid acetyltransferase, mitochondrial [Lithohypha guttulata]
MSLKLCHRGHSMCNCLHRRTSSVELTSLQCCKRTSTSQYRRHTSSAAAAPARQVQEYVQRGSHSGATGPLGLQAQQKQADREFFADVLSSAATKRDAKAYLNRLKSPAKTKSIPSKSRPSKPGSYVNVGNLFRGSRAAEMSPVFSQSPTVEMEFQETETLHVALVKIKDLTNLAQEMLDGIAETLNQLNRLSISPCVVIEPSTQDRKQLSEGIDRLVNVINKSGDIARPVDNLFSTRNTGQLRITNSNLLFRPLRKSKIPVIGNVAYNEDEQSMCLVTANSAVLALIKELAGLNVKPPVDEDNLADTSTTRDVQKQVSLDRIITIDSAGGIPNTKAADGRHVFLNLDQEYEVVRSSLQAKGDTASAILHSSNLDLLKQALDLLPHSSSGLMTTYEEAANSNKASQSRSASNVGTRRSKNALIHNLLTDKPAYSSSLPLGRLAKNSLAAAEPSVSHSSFIKRGMPLTIFPNPFETPWTPTAPRLKLTDPRIDLPRLVHLIEDSFNRKLDVGHYLNRVNNRIAGVVIAGEYEGGAILTWETPSGTSNTQPVPYLDKFAVLKRSQGAGGVADIVFNGMVRSCFPNGVCWRSRKDNPVNKWYFERSRGTWKLPGQNWTMFWTTPGVERGGEVFKGYESVCRGVMPSWADSKKPAD